MADFIAVIRRAVDGLSENTPEMRVKVYERARGAVQRQLENMKPRPPEAMLQRQLEKLEAAIREVEGEHSEAVPVEEPVAAAPEPEVHEEPALEQEPVEETAPVAEAAVSESHEQQEDVEPPVYEQPAEPEEAVQAAAPAEEVVPEHAEWHPPHEEEAPAEEWRAPEQAEVHAEPESPHEPVAEYYPEEPRPEEVAAEPVAETAHEVEEELQREEAHQPAPRGLDRASNRLVEPMADFEPQSQPQTSDFIEHTREEPIAMDAAAHFDRMWSEPAAETPAPVAQEAETEWAREELHSYAEATPAVPADASARALNEVSTLRNSASRAVMPAAKENFSWEAAAFDDLPPIEAGTDKKTPASAHFDDVDIFAEVHAGNGSGSAAPAPAAAPSEGWREARTLRGYDRRNAATDDDDSNPPMDLDQIVASKMQGKSFRMEPKRRRFGIGTILAILVTLGILGGAAYAGWMNREAVMEMVDGLVSSAPSQAARDETVTPATTPPVQQNSTPATAQPADQSATTPPARPNQEVASLDGSAANTKFTQRLLADGTEVDSGPAAVPGTPTAEGKSVAAQNVAAADTSTPSVQSDAAPAENLTPNGPAAAPAAQNTPIGATEKMFLYEERIGESSPTAIEGSVVWTVQHEAGQDGRQEATVQGNVTVPERNLSALVTFKRNSDPSLPASHLVEIVFSVPPNFEGGSIDSVQRISMKRTEQDRGDPLIAVPAKITDDFHMIALNDYPDARKANLDLLATRDWIDIPVTYRNGRRALLTMQKGATGGNAFNTAIKEWTALGDLSTSQ
jgi:hypothetical protein